MGYAKDGSGALFKNTEKKSDKHPDYRGDITIGGAKFWLAAWIKEGKNGKFMSLSAQPAEDKPANSGIRRNNNPDEDVPFAPIGKKESFLL